MNALVLGILVLLIMAVVVLGITRALVQTWVDHRVRLVLLESLEQSPESHSTAVQMLENLEKVSLRRRHDYALTGVILAVLGLAGTAYGRFVGIGRLAVGMYTGGMICVGLGFVLALVGLLIQYLASGTRNRKPLRDE